MPPGNRQYYVLYMKCYTFQAGGVETGWRTHMGGALELFACEEGAPVKVALKATPANNMFAFFAVGPESFHQVRSRTLLEKTDF